jgi:23S rRNA (uracil1939-C5)-methyltransferase
MSDFNPDPAQENLTRDDILWVHDLGWDGCGVARRNDGRVVMIPSALPGDTVEVEFTDEPKKGAVQAEIKAFIKPSPQRVAHPCPHHEQGCPASNLGAMRREFSLMWKRDHLIQTLKRIGHIEDVEVNDVIASPRMWRYRERLEFQLQRVGNHIQMGYTTKDGILSITDCRIGNVKLKAPYRRLKRNLQMLDAYPQLGDSVPLRLLLRDNGRDGVVAVVFGITRGRFDVKPIQEWLSKAELTGWVIMRSPTTESRFFASIVEAKDGDEMVHHWIQGNTIKMEPTAFSQANPLAADILAGKVIKEIPKDSKVLDLFGGYGLFALNHVERGGSAVVVESSPSAVEAGSEYAKQYKHDVKYFQMDLNKEKIAQLKPADFDYIILDPPRGGIHQQLADELNKTGSKKIIYVSCHPAALARDLSRMDNYKVEKIVPVDMFPTTCDLESIAFLEKK